MNLSEYEYMGKKVRITYVSHRGYFILSIDNRLFPEHFATKAEAVKKAFRVLGGGEEHSLLATFPSDSAVPEGFRVIGEVRAGSGVALDGIPQQPRGWDHFAG